MKIEMGFSNDMEKEEPQRIEYEDISLNCPL